MYNSSRISTVPETYSTIRSRQSEFSIDWKSLLLHFVRAFLKNSTFAYNGNTRSVEYEYHGRENQLGINFSPRARNYEVEKNDE